MFVETITKTTTVIIKIELNYYNRRYYHCYNYNLSANID